MASAVAIEGFDCDFVQELPEDLTCCVCQFAVRDPVQLGSCGHELCKICFQRLKDHATKTNAPLLCPLDRDVINVNKVFDDASAKRRVLNLNVYCSYKVNGCEWTGTLRHVEEHEQSCQKKIRNDKIFIDNVGKSLRSRVEQLEIVLDQLNTTVKGLETKIQQLSVRIESSFHWVVNYNRLRNRGQESSEFYMTTMPFCFQLFAAFKGNFLEVYLCRYRGKYDKPTGKIQSSFAGFMFEIYIVGINGQVRSHERPMDCTGFNFDIGSDNECSLGNGLGDFLTSENWGDWIINNHLHIYCKLKRKL